MCEIMALIVVSQAAHSDEMPSCASESEGCYDRIYIFMPTKNDGLPSPLIAKSPYLPVYELVDSVLYASSNAEHPSDDYERG